MGTRGPASPASELFKPILTLLVIIRVQFSEADEDDYGFEVCLD
jgi:hypothetical protein